MDGEGGPAVGAVCGGDGAAHEIAETAHEGETEAGAFAGVGGAGVEAREDGEELRDFFGREAGAGVVHGERKAFAGQCKLPWGS